MWMTAGRIPIAPGWVVRGIRASRADRKKHFHEFNSLACGRRDFSLLTFDLLRGDLGAFQRAVRAGESCGCKEVWVAGRRNCRRVSFQYAGRCLHEPAAPGRRAKILRTSPRGRPEVSGGPVEPGCFSDSPAEAGACARGAGSGNAAAF